MDRNRNYTAAVRAANLLPRKMRPGPKTGTARSTMQGDAIRSCGTLCLYRQRRAAIWTSDRLAGEIIRSVECCPALTFDNVRHRVSGIED